MEKRGEEGDWIEAAQAGTSLRRFQTIVSETIKFPERVSKVMKKIWTIREESHGRGLDTRHNSPNLQLCQLYSCWSERRNRQDYKMTDFERLNSSPD